MVFFSIDLQKYCFFSEHANFYTKIVNYLQKNEGKRSRFSYSKSCLFTTLPSIAVSAQHLAVAGNRASAFHPRGNMVSLHDFDIEGFAADGAFASLPLIDLSAGIGIKRADTQMVNVAVEDIGEDTALSLPYLRPSRTGITLS